ncbi:polyketide synthase dehydratase-domain-containing protein [Aspergillus granulosus]|uniref:Polyketide synthase dehydratase-domain-containing protein n=1 Tax=Aspergillus granulosus TaxID=176169 RepID=A0ABR4H212_9EURO
MAVNDVASTAARVIPDLPPYRWSYSQLLWRESRLSSDLRTRKYPRHELLGSEMAAGNGIDRVWKKTVRLNEVPWLGDHKLESQVAFPAAGYIAMVIEAVSQIKGIIETDASFVLQNINIASALTVYADEHQQADLYKLSLLIGFLKRPLLAAGTTLLSPHARMKARCPITVDTTGYEQWSMGPWYTELAEEGLIFGPAFQLLTSMKTDKTRVNPAAVSETVITQRASRSSYEGDYYNVHPLTINACLQAAIMGGTAGNLN